MKIAQNGMGLPTFGKLRAVVWGMRVINLADERKNKWTKQVLNWNLQDLNDCNLIGRRLRLTGWKQPDLLETSMDSALAIVDSINAGAALIRELNWYMFYCVEDSIWCDSTRALFVHYFCCFTREINNHLTVFAASSPDICVRFPLRSGSNQQKLFISGVDTDCNEATSRVRPPFLISWRWRNSNTGLLDLVKNHLKWELSRINT